MTKPIFIGIAGGSGAGKSTLCNALLQKYKDRIGLIQLDDYFKKIEEVSIYEGYHNFEHPDTILFDQFFSDLLNLSKGNAVTVRTKNSILNPEYNKTSKKIPITINPKPIILVEGYLLLWDKRIRDILDKSIWLDLDHKTRWGRRVHFKDDGYEKKVMIPMQKVYVEPTKQYANYIIDVSNLSEEEVFKKIEEKILIFY